MNIKTSHVGKFGVIACWWRGIYLLSLTSLCVAALLSPAQGAATELQLSSSNVSPVDREMDLQEKMRLREKIAHELEENRRRVLEHSNAIAGEKRVESSSTPDNGHSGDSSDNRKAKNSLP